MFELERGRGETGYAIKFVGNFNVLLIIIVFTKYIIARPAIMYELECWRDEIGGMK